MRRNCQVKKINGIVYLFASDENVSEFSKSATEIHGFDGTLFILAQLEANGEIFGLEPYNSPNEGEELAYHFGCHNLTQVLENWFPVG